MTSGNDVQEHEERVRARAYLIWEKEGRPDGHALAHWVKAKDEIEAEHRSAEATGHPGKPAA